MVLHRKYKYVNIIRYKILYVILITFIHNYMNVRFSGDKKMWSKLRYTSGSQPGKAQLVKKTPSEEEKLAHRQKYETDVRKNSGRSPRLVTSAGLQVLHTFWHFHIL